MLLQTAGTACCVISDNVWCSGSVYNAHQARHMYSWNGPGSDWIRQPDLPVNMGQHSMVYDKVHKAIWILASRDSPNVYRYFPGIRKWQTEQPLPNTRMNTESILCFPGKYIVTPGGTVLGSTSDTIDLTDITTGKTFTSHTKLISPLGEPVVACITRTRP